MCFIFQERVCVRFQKEPTDIDLSIIDGNLKTLIRLDS